MRTFRTIAPIDLSRRIFLKTGEVKAPVNASDLLDAYVVFAKDSGATLGLMLEQ